MKVKSRLAACVQDERLTFTFIPPSRSVFAPRRYAYDWVGAHFLNKTSSCVTILWIEFFWTRYIRLHAARYPVGSSRVYVRVTRKPCTSLSYGLWPMLSLDVLRRFYTCTAESCYGAALIDITPIRKIRHLQAQLYLAPLPPTNRRLTRHVQYCSVYAIIVARKFLVPFLIGKRITQCA